MFSPGHDTANALTSLALVAALVIAVRQDWVAHRIPNALVAALLAGGLLTHSIADGLEGLLGALAGAAVGLACLLPIHIARGMGAGDVKLMGAVGSVLGPLNAFLAACLTLVFGAVLGVGVVLWRLHESRAGALRSPSVAGADAGAQSVRLSAIGRERFPYAIAIGLGAVTTLWVSGMLGALFQGSGPG